MQCNGPDRNSFCNMIGIPRQAAPFPDEKRQRCCPATGRFRQHMFIPMRFGDGSNGFRKACRCRVKRDLGSRSGRLNPACVNGAGEHGERDHGVRHLGQALAAAGWAASVVEGPPGRPTSPQRGPLFPLDDRR